MKHLAAVVLTGVLSFWLGAAWMNNVVAKKWEPTLDTLSQYAMTGYVMVGPFETEEEALETFKQLKGMGWVVPGPRFKGG